MMTWDYRETFMEKISHYPLTMWMTQPHCLSFHELRVCTPWCFGNSLVELARSLIGQMLAHTAGTCKELWNWNSFCTKDLRPILVLFGNFYKFLLSALLFALLTIFFQHKKQSPIPYTASVVWKWWRSPSLISVIFIILKLRWEWGQGRQSIRISLRPLAFIMARNIVQQD